MKRIYFGLVSISLAVLVSCDPVAETIPAENETQTENGQVPEPEPEDVLSAGHRIFGFYEGGAVIEDFRED